MILETGTPFTEGRYLAYVEGFQGWLQPVIVTWRKDAWYFQYSAEKYTDRIYLWTLLPILTKEAAFSIAGELEFDL